jgi:hypothetical protein
MHVMMVMMMIGAVMVVAANTARVMVKAVEVDMGAERYLTTASAT